MITNNTAEYTALLTGLKSAIHLGIRNLHAHGDSQLVVNQVLGKWSCNAPHLRRLLQQVVDIVRRRFTYFDISHVRREDNWRADELANSAIDDKVTDCLVASVGSDGGTVDDDDDDDDDDYDDLLRGTPLSSREVVANNSLLHEVVTTIERDESRRRRGSYREEDVDSSNNSVPHEVTPTKERASRQRRRSGSTTVTDNNNNTGCQNNNVDEEELCSLVVSTSIDDDDDDDDNIHWTSKLPFLCQFEMERFNIRNKSSSSSGGRNENDETDYEERRKAIYLAHKGKASLKREFLSFLYNEEERTSTVVLNSSSCTSALPYDDHLKRITCSNNESLEVDEGTSCLFLFHAKLTTSGIELLPPEPTTDVHTRRIHRRYGTHRFLDLHCEETCTSSLVVLKQRLFKRHFNSDDCTTMELAGRKYGLLYSNPSCKTVVFRLFAEGGIGIRECDEITAPDVAARCIPSALNPGLSLTKYMKRMKLSFTSTVPSLIIKRGMLEVIPDIKAEDDGEDDGYGRSSHNHESLIMTDGCGLISREALDEVYSRYTYNFVQRCILLGKSNAIRHSAASSCPFSSFQGRIGGIKGMFVVDDSLNGVKIQCRHSQLKYDVPMTKKFAIPPYESDDDDALYNTVEIKEWDIPPPHHAYLSQNTIQLLEERGVQKEFFLSLAKKEIDELNSARKDYELLMTKYKARKYYHRDTLCLFEDDVFMRMLHARVNLNEPVMIRYINDFISDELKRYREKSKFPVIESMYLRMLPDHTGLLESNEVFVALGDESAQYSVERLGSVVAMRLPSYFTEDLRKYNNVISKADLIQRCPDKGKHSK